MVALDRALRGKDVITGEEKETPESLGSALKEYEREQGPQVGILILLLYLVASSRPCHSLSAFSTL